MTTHHAGRWVGLCVIGALLLAGCADDSERVVDVGPATSTTTVPLTDEEIQAQERESIGEVPSLEWVEFHAQSYGITDFDPGQAVFGHTLLGEIVLFLPPLVRQNLTALDPADFGVATIDEIPVVVGVYRAEPGQFTPPRGGPAGTSPPLAQDAMLIVAAQDTGPQTIGIVDSHTLDGIDEVLHG